MCYSRLMNAPLTDRPIKTRFTRESFTRAWDSGVWPDYPAMELIDGEVFTMPADGWRTTKWNTLLNRYLITECSGDVLVVPDKTLWVGDDGLKPDFWLFPATLDFETVTGADCLLVIEVSDTTLAWDLNRKAARYALGGVREYWVVDVPERRVHVHRLGADGQYGQPSVVAADQVIGPVHLLGLAFRLADAVG
jgi:Uma2 family endonuclease